MPAYNLAAIQNFLSTADTATTHADKGKAYEDLACYLFSLVPGIDITARNQLNTFATEEIDVACCNSHHADGLRFLNAFFFLVECKGWDNPVGSEQVSWFIQKIEHRGLDFGVLIAANDITGNAEQLSRAHFLVAAALMKKTRLVIITRKEISALGSGEDLARLIRDKLCQLHATGGRCH